MAELGETADPKALVPGDPDSIVENARVLRGRAQAATRTGEGLKRIDTGAWRGPAADAFHNKFSYEPVKWLQAGDSLNTGATVLEDYAQTLRWAQGQACEAIRQWEQGQNDTATEASRQAARDTLNRARQQLIDAGDGTAAALRSESETAPQERDWLDNVGDFVGDVVKGLWNAVSGFAETVWDILPIRAIWDPQGYADGLVNLVKGVWHSATHPVDFLKDTVDWEDWTNGHPGRAIGQIVGGVAIGGAVGKLFKGLRGHKPHDEHGGAETSGERRSKNIQLRRKLVRMSCAKRHSTVMETRWGSKTARGCVLSMETSLIKSDSIYMINLVNQPT